MKRLNQKNIEAQAAKARADRQTACTTEFQTLMTTLLAKHNCRVEVVAVVGGQQVLISEVLALPVLVRVIANVE